MARTRSISSIDTGIVKVEKDLAKAQARYDGLVARLLELQQLKKEYESRQILDAFHRSGKSLSELMAFLKV